MELTLGRGTVLIGSIKDVDGRRGVLLRQTDKEHEIGSLDTEWEPEKTYVPTDDDVVIWLNNLEGARVLQDRVNYECLMLDGWDKIPMDEVQ